MPKVNLGKVEGKPGATGATGAPGERGESGKGFNIRGEWQAGTYYNNTDTVCDIVVYMGSAYYCITSNAETTPPPENTEKWGLFVSGSSGMRLVFPCTISGVEWESSGLSAMNMYLWKVRKYFPHGHLQADGLYNIAMDGGDREKYGIVIAEIDISTPNDSILFYAEARNTQDVDVKVYFDTIPEVVINGN